MIIGNVRDARQMVPDPDWKAEDHRGARARTSGGNSKDEDNQGGDMTSRRFKEESKRGGTKKVDSKKKPAQLKKNDNRATQDVKVQGGNTEVEYVSGQVLMKAQKSDKFHPLKVKEAVNVP